VIAMDEGTLVFFLRQCLDAFPSGAEAAYHTFSALAKPLGAFAKRKGGPESETVRVGLETFVGMLEGASNILSAKINAAGGMGGGEAFRAETLGETIHVLRVACLAVSR